jgi:3'-5' exonuclease
MRSRKLLPEDFRTDTVVAFDIETLQPPLPADEASAPAGFQKWPHHRPLVASFLRASALGGGAWEFSLDSVIFEPGEEAQAFARIEELLPEHGIAVSHFGRGFDASVLALSAQAFRCATPKLSRLARDPRFGRYHIDTADLFSNHRAAQTPSLKELCDRLGIPCKTSVAGSDVETLAAQGRLDLIAQYCEEDVIATALCLFSFVSFRDSDEAKLAEPAAALASWIEASPTLAHLLPFTTCPLVQWARERVLFLKLGRAADAARQRQRQAAAKRELVHVIDF